MEPNQHQKSGSLNGKAELVEFPVAALAEKWPVIRTMLRIGLPEKYRTDAAITNIMGEAMHGLVQCWFLVKERQDEDGAPRTVYGIVFTRFEIDPFSQQKYLYILAAKAIEPVDWSVVLKRLMAIAKQNKCVEIRATAYSQTALKTALRAGFGADGRDVTIGV